MNKNELMHVEAVAIAQELDAKITGFGAYTILTEKIAEGLAQSDA